jgi:hypothetical protein
MKTKRILGVLLALVFLLGLLPTAALAAEAPVEVSTWSELYNAFQAGGDIILDADVTYGEGGGDHSTDELKVPTGVEAKLDLNGHTVDRALWDVSWGDQRVLTVTGILTLTDSGSGGKLTGGWPQQYGGGVYVNGGTFNMEGGSITGNSVGKSGMFDGVDGLGAGVYIQTGTFNMKGGTITGNHAVGKSFGNNQGRGGGVFVNSGTFNMTGGTVSGNDAGLYGGGVYVSTRYSGNDGVFKLSGGASVTGNTLDGAANNVFLEEGGIITVSGTLTGTLGVTMMTPGVFTSGLSGYGTEANFTSDDSDYKVSLTDGGEAQLVENPTYTVTVTAGTGMTKTTDSGDAAQSVAVGEAMTDVLYNADNGYYFPEDYAVDTVNGVSVTRVSETQIKVSGTPTADVAITLPAATAPTYYDLYIAGVQVNSFIADDLTVIDGVTVADGGEAKYDDATYTLTLKDASIDGAPTSNYGNNATVSVMNSISTLTVSFAGTNSIGCEGNNVGYSNALGGRYTDFVFTGADDDAVLTVSARTTPTAENGAGRINTLTVNKGTVVFEAPEESTGGSYGNNPYGVSFESTSSDVVTVNGGKLICKGWAPIVAQMDGSTYKLEDFIADGTILLGSADYDGAGLMAYDYSTNGFYGPKYQTTYRYVEAGSADQKFTITFKDDDGESVLQSGEVAYGSTPEYTGEEPTKEADAQYTYTFAGWTPEITAATSDAEYTATYGETLNRYSVTFVDYDGTVLKEAAEYDYGTKAEDIAKPDDPTRASDGTYTYTFAGWSPELADVTEDAEYMATYDAEAIPVIVEPEPEPVPVPAPALPFTDVSEDMACYDDVKYVYEEGIMNGVSDTLFAPEEPLLRCMIVTILYRLEGEPEVEYGGTFSDVPDGKWYSAGVEWAASVGIVLGYGDGTFGVADDVTREQLAVILHRYAVWKGYDVSVGEDTNILSYGDAFDIAEWAMPAMQWACGAEIYKEDADGNIRPAEAASRSEIANMIHIFMEKVAK